jgi:hypothetical protein
MSLNLRPHHILCSIGFDGQGDDPAFTANLTKIVIRDLRGPVGERQRILITGTADSICAPCPKRRDLGCEDQVLIDRLDARHGAALGLAPGDRLDWGACLDRVRENVAPGDLDTLCAGCGELASGRCKAAVARLARPALAAE